MLTLANQVGLTGFSLYVDVDITLCELVIVSDESKRVSIAIDLGNSSICACDLIRLTYFGHDVNLEPVCSRIILRAVGIYDRDLVRSLTIGRHTENLGYGRSKGWIELATYNLDGRRTFGFATRIIASHDIVIARRHILEAEDGGADLRVLNLEESPVASV